MSSSGFARQIEFPQFPSSYNIFLEIEHKSMFIAFERLLGVKKIFFEGLER